MDNQTSNIRTEVVKTPITLSRIYKADFQKDGTMTAELRQSITTKSFYPSAKTETDKQKGLFSTSEFGFKEKDYESKEERVAWLLVPANATVEATSAKLAAHKEGTLYKVLSNAPFLDENQKYAIANGLRTMDEYAEKQAVRYPENHAEKPNELILDKAGNVQYRRIFYWDSPMADQDIRSTDPTQIYVPQSFKVELQGASVLQGQNL